MSASRSESETRVVVGVIDGRCDCQACLRRTGDMYRMVSRPCTNCGSGPYLLLYRAGDKAADQDCPVCKGYWTVKPARLATPDEIPAAALSPFPTTPEQSALPSRCTEPCWTPLPCPECGRTMNPRGRSAPLEMECLREPCPADDSRVNPRHLWSADDDERWRFYPDEGLEGKR